MVPLLAVLLVLAGLTGAGLVQVAGAAARSAAAQAAADAAALAGAAAGRDAAERVAAENGAEVVSYLVIDADVIVAVRRARTGASARARLATNAVGPPSSDPPSWEPPGRPVADP